MARSTGETVLWSLFAVGGVVAALFIPALIIITGFVVPFVQLGGVPGLNFGGFPAARTLVFSVLGRLVLLVAISLPLIHCAHRLVHTSKDIGLRGLHGLIAALFYGGAFLATGFAVWVLWL